MIRPGAVSAAALREAAPDLGRDAIARAAEPHPDGRAADLHARGDVLGPEHDDRDLTKLGRPKRDLALLGAKARHAQGVRQQPRELVVGEGLLHQSLAVVERPLDRERGDVVAQRRHLRLLDVADFPLGVEHDDPRIGRDPQPAHMRDYVETAADNGGVHINSGIPNHAFFLAAQAFGGYAWERAGRVWYEALTSRLEADADFRDAARATIDVAGTRYDLEAAHMVRAAWSDVGVRTTVRRRVRGRSAVQGRHA